MTMTSEYISCDLKKCVRLTWVVRVDEGLRSMGDVSGVTHQEEARGTDIERLRAWRR